MSWKFEERYDKWARDWSPARTLHCICNFTTVGTHSLTSPESASNLKTKQQNKKQTKKPPGPIGGIVEWMLYKGKDNC